MPSPDFALASVRYFLDQLVVSRRARLHDKERAAGPGEEGGPPWQPTA